MNEAITTTYQDTVITYDEGKNKWLFTLRGRDRSAESLVNAKMAIEAPPPREEKPFRRFEAWYKSYGGGTQKVTVTSMTEGGRFWVTYEGRNRKERTQAGGHELYPCDPKNDSIMGRVEVKRVQLASMRDELESIYAELRHVEAKDWE